MAAPRVELRPLGPGDKDRLLVWRNSPEVAAYMYTDHRIAEDEHARWFAGIEGDERRAYWIVEADGRPVGLANFYDIDRRDRSASWAWYLADPGVRGRGIGRYVQYRMIEKAFTGMGLQRLRCEALESNERALRLYRAYGFRDEARLPGRTLKNGAPEDAIALVLEARDWAEARAEITAALRASGFPEEEIQDGVGDPAGARPIVQTGRRP